MKIVSTKGLSWAAPAGAFSSLPWDIEFLYVTMLRVDIVAAAMVTGPGRDDDSTGAARRLIWRFPGEHQVWAATTIKVTMTIITAMTGTITTIPMATIILTALVMRMSTRPPISVRRLRSASR